MENKTSYLFLAPWLVLFLSFILAPFFTGIFISLNDYDFFNMNFVGFGNYLEIFRDEMFIKTIGVTILIAAIAVPSIIFLSLWVSKTIISFKNKSIQTFLKAFFYIPAVVSSVALIITIKWIFNPAYGLSTYITNMLGVDAINWYGNPSTAIFLIIFLVVLIGLGIPVILFTAAMNSIPKSLYEAADIDGATELQKFFWITIPLIKPTMVYVLITLTIGGFQIFEFPLLLTGGGPQYTTTTIMLTLYRTAFNYGKFGLASAMGVILFLFIMVFALIQFRFLKSDIQY